MLKADKVKEKEDEDNKPKDPTTVEKKIPYSRMIGLVSDSWLLMTIGILASILNGCIMPAFAYVFGELFNSIFANLKYPERLKHDINLWSGIFALIGVTTFTLTYLTHACWVYISELFEKRLKQLLFASLMKQEIGFYDRNRTGEILTKMSSSISMVKAGVSEKFALIFYFITQVIAGVILAFVRGWKMTLVMLAASPVLILASALGMRAMAAMTKRGKAKSAEADALANETITGYRTVLAFVAESTLMNKFYKLSDDAFDKAMRSANVQGLSTGFAYFFIFAVHGLGFWYGGTLVQSGEMSAGTMLTVFMSIMMGAMGLGQGSALMPDVAKSLGSAMPVFAIIDRPVLLDYKNSTQKLDSLRGHIKFDNVVFEYPTRPGQTVLKKLCIEIFPGTVCALVGQSGGGKSTCIQLLERYYDPIEGTVTIDGVNLRDLDLKWFRSRVGIVSQEPTLFSGSIEDNIKWAKDSATKDEVIEAAKAANAHQFISDLQNGYDTQVGEKGVTMSGGQRQRIAIARAVLQNPQILLLDEATSALDTESERLVQEALDKLMQGRTTIVIAHRLATVRDANKIVVINKGVAVEEGTHDELVAKGGAYATLVGRQIFAHKNIEEEFGL